MSNDNGLVDEFEKLQSLKKDIEAKEEELKERIIELAKQNNTEVLFGTSKKCFVKGYEKVVYPEDKTFLTQIIKDKGLYEKFSSVNYFKLSPAIIKGEVGREVTDLVRKEKAFRVFLKDIQGGKR
ncbi:hypothetical protein A3K73_05095 [Candidatus Pacearchaeota archaeon RBG_13_36_9]|nr:MAG: hypothetical protein A3K73_05095 [Candidatus Pacearchaeota archaeon RBG_13_36_9]